MHRFALVVVAAGLFAVVASPALAQDDAGGGEARTLFKQGQTAYGQGAPGSECRTPTVSDGTCRLEGTAIVCKPD